MDFDPAKHPRNTRGEFSSILDKLEKGAHVSLPDGQKVSRAGAGKRDEFVVHHPSGGVSQASNAQEAADHALTLSAKSTHPQSLGGAKSHPNLPAALKANRARARRQVKSGKVKEAVLPSRLPDERTPQQKRNDRRTGKRHDAFLKDKTPPGQEPQARQADRAATGKSSTQSKAVELDKAYQALIDKQTDTGKKNRVYKEYRNFTRTGAVGPIGRRLQEQQSRRTLTKPEQVVPEADRAREKTRQQAGLRDVPQSKLNAESDQLVKQAGQYREAITGLNDGDTAHFNHGISVIKNGDNYRILRPSGNSISTKDPVDATARVQDEEAKAMRRKGIRPPGDANPRAEMKEPEGDNLPALKRVETKAEGLTALQRRLGVHPEQVAAREAKKRNTPLPQGTQTSAALVRKIAGEQGVNIESEQPHYPYDGMVRINTEKPLKLGGHTSRTIDVQGSSITPMRAGGVGNSHSFMPTQFENLHKAAMQSARPKPKYPGTHHAVERGGSHHVFDTQGNHRGVYNSAKEASTAITKNTMADAGIEKPSDAARAPADPSGHRAALQHDMAYNESKSNRDTYDNGYHTALKEMHAAHQKGGDAGLRKHISDKLGQNWNANDFTDGQRSALQDYQKRLGGSSSPVFGQGKRNILGHGKAGEGERINHLGELKSGDAVPWGQDGKRAVVQSNHNGKIVLRNPDAGVKRGNQNRTAVTQPYSHNSKRLSALTGIPAKMSDEPMREGAPNLSEPIGSNRTSPPKVEGISDSLLSKRLDNLKSNPSSNDYVAHHAEAVKRGASTEGLPSPTLRFHTRSTDRHGVKYTTVHDAKGNEVHAEQSMFAGRAMSEGMAAKLNRSQGPYTTHAVKRGNSNYTVVRDANGQEIEAHQNAFKGKAMAEMRAAKLNRVTGHSQPTTSPASTATQSSRGEVAKVRLKSVQARTSFGEVKRYEGTTPDGKKVEITQSNSLAGRNWRARHGGTDLGSFGSKKDASDAVTRHLKGQRGQSARG